MSGALIIAIDGPAASGKGTLARRIAATLGLPYLDTGLLYRAVARKLMDAHADPRDPLAATRAAESLQAADLKRSDLRGEECGAVASLVALMPSVRAALLDFQRGFAARAGGAQAGAVLDGRDIGTVIFPHAAVKLFVTASLQVRAERRCREIGGVLPDVIEELAARDLRDQGRSTAPLKPAPDALLLDTSDLDTDGAFHAAMKLIRGRLS